MQLDIQAKRASNQRLNRWLAVAGAVLLAGAFVTTALALPIITASKTDALLVDADNSGGVTPGDTLRYTVVIANSGSDPASSVVFSDTIDAGTTLSGVAHVSPIAFDDSYNSLGNVGITVPAANGVLANDVDPDGFSSLSVVPNAGASTHGAFAINADGSFSYASSRGYEGPDSFNYTLTDNDPLTPNATGTVNITVNEVIWFIDNSQPTQGTGVIGNPFNSLDGASGFNATAPDDPGDIVFLYSGSGSYSGGIALLNNQILIGQGASASIAAISGITVPPYSNPLPGTGGARPTITSSAAGVTLAQDNTLRGFNVGNTAARGITDNGSSVGTLTISEVADTGTGTGIEINNGGTLAVTLDSVNASGGANGIDLQGTTGSFSVTGTGAANSGGTLSGHTAEGVYLNNVSGISLTDMVINQSGTSSTQGIDATDVTGLTLIRTTITAGNSSSYALLGSTITNLVATSSTFDGGGGSVANIDAVRISNLLGGNTITNSTFRNGKDINLLIENTATSGNPDLLTISGTTFSNSAGGDHLQVDTNSAANLKLTVTGNSSFSGTGQDGMQLEAQGSANLQATVNQTTISGNTGSAVNMAATGTAHLIARISGLTNLASTGTNVINMINFDTSLIEATVENNTITSATAGNGIRVIQEGNGTITAKLSGNTIGGVTQASGILVQGRAGTGGNGRINATIDNNNVTTTGSLSLDGVEVTSGSSAGGDTNTICLNLYSNTSVSGALDGYFLRHRAGSTFQLQDFAGPATNAGITAWVNTTKSNTGTVFVTNAAGFTNAPADCPLPAVPTATTPGPESGARGQTRPASASPAAAASAPDQTPAATASLPAALPASGETVNVNIGTLPAGRSVTIIFDVTVDAPTSPQTIISQVCNQGTVSGNNFSNVLTDDPDAGGAADPTCTALQVGSIGIVKDQVPDGNNIFGFTSSIPGIPSFNVVGDGGMVSLVNITPGSYTVTEDDPAPLFALTGLVCNDDASGVPSTGDTGTRRATINLEPGESVICTFTNTQQGVDLQLTKSDGAVTAEPGDTIAYTLAYTNAGGVGATGVVLTDTVPANTTFNAGASTGGWVCTPDGNAGSTCTLAVGALAGGANGSATFAVDAASPLPPQVTQIDNTACIGDDGASGPDQNPGDNCGDDTTPVVSGSITIVKATNPAGGTGFNFTGDLGVFSLDDGGQQPFSGLASGDYDVIESAAAGWLLASVSCQGGGYTQIPGGVTVNLDPGENITCTFTNQQLPLFLALSKSVNGPTSLTLPGGAGAVSYTVAYTSTAVVTGTAVFTDTPSIDLGGVVCSDLAAAQVGPGQSGSQVVDCTVTITPDRCTELTATLNNTVVAGFSPLDGVGAGAPPVTITVPPSDPNSPLCNPLFSIVLTKTVGLDPLTCALDDMITVPTGGVDVVYCYTVQNSGNISMTVHDLVDSQLGTILNSFPYTLTPGASVFVTTTAYITATTVNTATWTATSTNPTGSAESSASATVIVMPPTAVRLSRMAAGTGEAAWPPALPAVLGAALAAAGALSWRRRKRSPAEVRSPGKGWRDMPSRR